MALTQNTYTGNGSTVLFSFTFPYLQEADVKVKLNGVTQATTTYSFANATQIQMNTAPANGVSIIIFRDTNNDAKKATFYPGSAIKAEDLNDDFDQILYTAQEVDNNAMSTLGDDPMQGDLSMGNNKLTNLATPTASTDGTNKTYVDSTIDSKVDTAMANDVLAGTDIAKSSSGGQVTISHNVSGADTTVNNSDGNVIQDITITAQGHVTSVGSKNLNDVYYTESELNAGQLDNRYYTETELNAGQLDNRYYTETELLNGALDGRYFTETEADSRYYNLASGEEIQSGETWSAADNKIATTAAIDARIVDLVDDVGGFVPIANETSFPNANPDVNNGAGTLVSIQSLASNLTSSGGGVATISNGTVGNSTVTISGLDASTTYNAGFGMIVETTSTLNTYTFHRLVPKATEVTTVAGNITNINTVGNNNTNINTVAAANSTISTVATNISNVNNVGGSIANVNTVASNINSVNDFSDVYRIASSAPTSHLHEGDLYFDTSANELKVYNGSAWQGGVTATGNLAGLGANTFTGNQSLGDNNKVVLGTGSDLQIYHNGSHSFISDLGTGDLRLTGSTIKILDSAQSENILEATENGAVKLFYDNSKKFETTSTGAKCGQLETSLAGYTAYPNLQIERTGTANGKYGFKLNNDSGNDCSLLIRDEKANVTRLTISSAGHLEIPDNGKLQLGDGTDLQISHNGANASLIDAKAGDYLYIYSDNLRLNSKTGTEKYVSGAVNGAVELYYDNSLKARTQTWGWEVFGNIHADDNYKLNLGTGNDLQIYHDGTDSRIQNSTGDLFIRTVSSGDDILLDSVDDIFLRVAGAESGIEVLGNSSTKLYYDNSKKFETQSTGAQVSGRFITLDSGANGIHSRSTTTQATDSNKAFKIRNNSDTDTFSISYKGNVYLPDSNKINFGSGNDLQIYHSGSSSYIRDVGTGTLYLDTNGNDISLISDGSVSNGKMGRFYKDGAVELYYDNSKKLETTSGGVNVTGALTVNGSALASGSMTLIDSVTVGSSNTYSLSFGSSWWNTYKHLKIKYWGTYYPGDSGGSTGHYFRYNSVSSSGAYKLTALYGTSTSQTEQTYGRLIYTYNPSSWTGRKFYIDCDIYSDGSTTTFYSNLMGESYNKAGHCITWVNTAGSSFTIHQPHSGSQKYRFPGTAYVYGVN